jgi:hypothetical protein
MTTNTTMMSGSVIAGFLLFLAMTSMIVSPAMAFVIQSPIAGRTRLELSTYPEEGSPAGEEIQTTFVTGQDAVPSINIPASPPLETSTLATTSGGVGAANPASQDEPNPVDDPLNVWDRRTPTMVQGGSLRTWSFSSQNIKTTQVHLRTDGRPMNANGEY